MCSLGIEPTTFALLTQCSTTEPQEHRIIKSSTWHTRATSSDCSNKQTKNISIFFFSTIAQLFLSNFSKLFFTECSAFGWQNVTLIFFAVCKIKPQNRPKMLLFSLCAGMTSKPERLILHGFYIGFSNGVFQFMSKTRSVVNITWQNVDVLLYKVNYTCPYFIFENIFL